MGAKTSTPGEKMLDKIFSIKEYSETHNKITLFGIKIKTPKLEVLRLKKKLPYEQYKKENLDITTLPPATGQLREMQLANFALLEEFDYVCKQNNIKYWIDFGTLLGAFRHNGFIPWDDDIDLGMLREDYVKIIDIFNKNTRDDNIFASYFYCKNKPCQLIIKILHKKCPHLFLDIFPYDNYGKALSKSEQLLATLKIKDLRKEMEKTCLKFFSIEETQNFINSFKQKLITNNEDNHDYVWGIDFNHHWKNWFVNKEILFPLGEIEFEGKKFPCVNNIEYYLEKVYGNFMCYPKKFGYGHNAFVKLNDIEKKYITELARKSETNYNIRNI